MIGLRSMLATCAVAALAACGGKGAAHPSQPGLELTEDGIAGIVAKTSVDDATLLRLVPGAELRPDPDHPDVREVWRGGERLFYVVYLADGHPEDGPFGVHVTSPSIPAPHGWKVGAPLASTAGLDACTCWGDDMPVCFATGTHVAVALDHAGCEAVPGLGAIAGKTITKLVWNPAAWPETPSLGDQPETGDLPTEE